LTGHLLMSAKERDRLKVMARVKTGGIRLVEAAEILGLSYRQSKRLNRRYLEEGDPGLIHRGRGQPGNRGYDESFKRAVLARYQERYPDFGPTLAAEKLDELDNLMLDHETLRLWLLEAGLWKKRRRRAAHRSWRERRAHFGEMVQMDGSFHKWFEDRGPECSLMNLVDDATGTTLSLFSEQETTEAAMTLLWAWIEKYGIPAAIYADGKNVYLPDERLQQEAREQGEELYSQFGSACAKLRIRIIRAYSPQAKGRVERSNGVYQDRLVKELRLQKINSIEKANELLFGGFVDRLNEKFAVKPRKSADYHRSQKNLNLASIFCWEEERMLTDDWIVRFRNHYYQLDRQSQRPPTTKKVQVCQWLNGELHFRYRNQDLPYKELPDRPESDAKKPKYRRRAQPKPKWIPPANHPWRSFIYGAACK
jgi:transposase